MQDKKLLYVLGFVLLVALAAVGWVLWSRASKEAGTTTIVPSEVVDVQEATKETSKTVLDETKTASGQTIKSVSGKLVSIDGQKLVLESDGDRVQVLVAVDAQITRTAFLADRTVPPQTEVISLADLKVGDRIDAFVKTENGVATASSVKVVVSL